MIVGEYFYARRCDADTTKILFGYNIPTWLWGAYEKVRFCSKKQIEFSLFHMDIQIKYDPKTIQNRSRERLCVILRKTPIF